jgi:predicted nucleic acid-binding protein
VGDAAKQAAALKVRAFFDSNVLVYAFTAGDSRREVAWRLIEQHAADNSLVLSTQVLMETYNVLTRKRGAAAADVLVALRLLARHEVVAPGAPAALRALELSVQHKLSAWDALIVQAALEGACDALYSEDMQAGRRFGTLEIVNPFELKAHEPAPALKAPRPRAPRAGRARP